MAGILKVDQYQDFNGNTIMTSDGAGNITVNATGMKMTPAFEAYLSASQNVSNLTYTKVEIDTEVLDTDNMYDNSTNYRFTPTTAGKYFVFCGLRMGSNISSRMTYTQIALYKNGSIYQNSIVDPNDSYPENTITISQTAVVDMNGSSDYLELFGRCEASSATPKFVNGTQTHFGAYKIIGA